jgi:hypothetical protein
MIGPNGSRKEDGGIKLDPGKLPLYMPEVEFKYFNKVHRKKIYDGSYYKIEKTDPQLKNPDCEHMKHNFSLCLWHNSGPATGKATEEFKTGMEAVLEHTFNNHEHCSEEWCKYMVEANAELDDADHF